jgi:hypothetical protein
MKLGDVHFDVSEKKLKELLQPLVEKYTKLLK